MKHIKIVATFILSFYSFFGFSCDDRLPSSSTTVETGTIELHYAFVDQYPEPTVLGEIIASNPTTKLFVIARLLDADGNGVNDKVLSFDGGVYGGFSVDAPSTKYYPNFKELGFPDLSFTLTTRVGFISFPPFTIIA